MILQVDDFVIVAVIAVGCVLVHPVANRFTSAACTDRTNKDTNIHGYLLEIMKLIQQQ